MINLIWSDNGTILCYKPDDWFKLRKQWRIIGDFVGNTFYIPTLPLKLHPEEVLLLLDKNIVQVVRIQTNDNDDNKEIYQQFEDKLFVEQQAIYKEYRRQQLLSMLDDIVKAKRKFGDDRTPEQILNDELNKSCTISKDNLIWPINLTPLNSNCFTPISQKFISDNSRTNQIKSGVYRDLWDRGYFITSGQKFGGDFLVYLGDPINYHAIFVVRCVLNMEQKFNSTEIVQFGRLCNAVKKRAILATINNSIVQYLTISWIDS